MAIRYYGTGNTAKGFVNYIDWNIIDMERIIVLKHESDKVKTSVIQEIIAENQHDQSMEILLSPLGEQYLDGVLLKDSSIAILADQVVSTAIKSELLDLQTIYPPKIDQHKRNQQQKHIHHSIQTAYEHFAAGLSIHDKLEAVYVDQMDFVRADELADNLIYDLLKHREERNRRGKVYKRLFGTNTPDGAVNVVPELIEAFSNVTFIKGRAGTGKSTFMKKISDACVKFGLDVEQYHCSFDPDGIDMIAVRDLDFCIFDSTDPHEFFPKNEHHRVIDLYEETVAPDIDELFAEKIQELTSSYKSYMKQGVQSLREAGKVKTALENNYSLLDREQLKRLTRHHIFPK